MDTPLLFVGQTRRLEWTPLVARLRATTSVVTAADLPGAKRLLDEGLPIQRILLAPSYRDEFSVVQLQRLLHQRPLAEWVVVVGPWIEGETRSGKPWAGARRMYLDQVIPWLESTQLDVPAAQPAAWRPATWTADEAWLELAGRAWPSQSGTVVVCSELAESRRSLAAVCASAGWRTVALAPGETVEGEGVEAAIYDAVADRHRWHRQLRQLVQRCRPQMLVVLMNFPRPDESQWMLAAGATSVLGKPFQIDHLLRSLRRHLPLVRAEGV
jgi:CheY-like chemotaxis protein